MAPMTPALMEHQLKRSIKSLISSTRANLMAKTRYSREKAHWKNRIVHLIQISWPGINNKFILVKAFAPDKLN